MNTKVTYLYEAIASCVVVGTCLTCKATAIISLLIQLLCTLAKHKAFLCCDLC